MTRTRTRGGASAPSGGAETTQPTGSFYKRGAAAVAEAQKAQKESERKRSTGGKPLSFYVKKGEDCEIIILDKSLENGISFYQHRLQGRDGKWDIEELCIKDMGIGECPICQNHKESSFVLNLTVLVLKSFETKKGKTIPWSRMLLPITITQFDLFTQLEDSAKKEGKSLRGMYLIMKRGNGDKSPRIGEPAILEGGKIYDILPEEVLVADYGHPAEKNDKGEVFRVANQDITPIDYDKVFPRPDVNDIMARYGGKPLSGSTREAMLEFNEAEGAGGEEAAAAPATGTRLRRRAASADDKPFED